MTLPTPRVEVGEGDIACPLTSTLLSKLPPSDPIFERGKRNSYLPPCHPRPSLPPLPYSTCTVALNRHKSLQQDPFKPLIISNYF